MKVATLLVIAGVIFLAFLVAFVWVMSWAVLSMESESK